MVLAMSGLSVGLRAGISPSGGSDWCAPRTVRRRALPTVAR